MHIGVIDKVWAQIEYWNYVEDDPRINDLEHRFTPGAVMDMTGKWHPIIKDETPYEYVSVYIRSNGRVILSERPF